MSPHMVRGAEYLPCTSDTGDPSHMSSSFITPRLFSRRQRELVAIGLYNKKLGDEKARTFKF